jgi:hypothetical protein
MYSLTLQGLALLLNHLLRRSELGDHHRCAQVEEMYAKSQKPFQRSSGKREGLRDRLYAGQLDGC